MRVDFVPSAVAFGISSICYFVRGACIAATQGKIGSNCPNIMTSMVTFNLLNILRISVCMCNKLILCRKITCHTSLDMCWVCKMGRMHKM